MNHKLIAIVTGANGGFGKEFVRIIANENEVDEIWAVARNEEKLGKLKGEFGEKIRIFSKDLSDLEQIKSFEKVLESENVRVKYLINNAGYAKFCSYDDLSVDESVNMIDLNISGVVAMGLICIPYMDKNSHIINIASQASFQPLPYQNIYSSTKAFVRNYTRALNVELKGTGITATAVCPGWMKTGLYDRGIINAKKATNNFFGMVEPDVVAKKAMLDAKKNKDVSVYGLLVKFCHMMGKFLPQRVMMKIWLIQQHL